MIESKRAADFSKEGSIEVTIAPNAGACFGVVRAIKLAEHAISEADESNPVFALGALVHNPPTIAQFESQGLKIVDSPNAITSGTAILRSHGIRQEIEMELREKGIGVVDATCPLVKKPQRIAKAMAAKGYYLVLVGDENHPEVRGVLSYYGKPDYLVTYQPADIEKIPVSVKRVAVLAQTTIEVGVLNAVVEKCQERFSETVVYNTICDATAIRQSEAEILAQKADVMVVVGGRNSSNTSKLVKICKKYQPDTHLVQEMSEIQREWFVGKRKIGVTGGAATPQDYVDEVGTFIVSLIQKH